MIMILTPLSVQANVQFSLLNYKKQKKITPLKPCSHRASALMRALMLFNLSRTHFNFDTSVDTATKCEDDAIETNVESIPFKRQR